MEASDLLAGGGGGLLVRKGGRFQLGRAETGHWQDEVAGRLVGRFDDMGGTGHFGEEGGILGIILVSKLAREALSAGEEGR